MDPVGRRAENALAFSLLVAAVAIGAFLRFDALGETSYWLDEALDEIFSRNALTHPWWHWLTGFGREHGPLHFAIQLATHFGDELAGRFPAALCGTATIAALWLAARLLDVRAAGVCALLVATSPFAVYYSREARPYALLMLLATALLIAVLRESVAGVAIVSILALYTSAIAAALVAAAVVAALVLRKWKIAIVAFAIAALFPLLYRSDPAGTGAVTPHIDATEIARAFTVSATGADQRGHTVIALLVFAAVGAVALLRRDRRTGAAVIAFALLPIAIVLAMVVVSRHFFALRYLATALPPFLLLAAAGIATITRTPFVAAVVAIVVMTQTWSTARIEPLRKLNWREIANAIAARAKPEDTLVTADAVADVMLRHYLRDVPHAPRIASIPYVSVLETVGGARWIATTYNASDLSVRDWACRHPLLLASNLEGFRLHYAGPFLRERALPADMRALGAVEPLVLRPGTNDELFLGEGWAAADHVEGRTYRWATSTSATLIVPRFGKRDRTLVFNALPVPPQTMRVSVNGTSVGEQVIREGWHEYTFDAPAAVWRDGLNTIRLDFARTTILTTDPRSLAVLFESIAIGGKGDVSRIPPQRISALVEWPGRAKHSRPAPPDLLARLGLDPTLNVETDDAARTVAWGPECEDDRTFLRRAFAALLERGPNAIEERDLLERMRRGTPRVEIVERILDAAPAP
jgi:mannosyltransferase